ncbi:4Fe-4S dicluster domain-containing protein [Sulfurospirillum sp. T05]|uniref:4Fe-4S dicluster domain-containing protein n=1 Tax=Sulfurospirillum tamanense TaxID=2813362 RepID=A0ABS2WPQ5_9BACT|nr:4Fe-4S dicluster domain-containing protein [Sulfurospirillum tamanensis]MBN2963204.1 4Fe-4S dicluster domain-containing protein [Sulfurospirillum tamanensis]
MPNDPSRRRFLKQGGIAALAGATSAQAFSLKNPGRDAQDPRYIGDAKAHYAMVIDLRQCVGCQACTAACKVENAVPKEQYRTFVSEFEIGTFPHVRKGYVPQLCNHCDNPSCVSVCPTGATFKRKDGIVVVDSEICWGCGYCLNACPYDKRYFNAQTKVADKCTFCAHRLQDGLLPSCVETCVGGARIFGDQNDPNSEVSKMLATFPTSVLKPHQGNAPQVFYISLDSRLEAVHEATPMLDDVVRKELGLLDKEWPKLPRGVS